MFGGKEPPAEKFNGGEKLIFWVSMIGGALGYRQRLCAAVPVLRHHRRRTWNWPKSCHSVVAVLYVAAMLVHIYMGTHRRGRAPSKRWPTAMSTSIGPRSGTASGMKRKCKAAAPAAPAAPCGLPNSRRSFRNAQRPAARPGVLRLMHYCVLPRDAEPWLGGSRPWMLLWQSTQVAVPLASSAWSARPASVCGLMAAASWQLRQVALSWACIFARTRGASSARRASQILASLKLWV